jgi:hypothetical protein
MPPDMRHFLLRNSIRSNRARTAVIARPLINVLSGGRSNLNINLNRFDRVRLLRVHEYEIKERPRNDPEGYRKDGFS